MVSVTLTLNTLDKMNDHYFGRRASVMKEVKGKDSEGGDTVAYEYHEGVVRAVGLFQADSVGNGAVSGGGFMFTIHLDNGEMVRSMRLNPIDPAKRNKD